MTESQWYTCNTMFIFGLLQNILTADTDNKSLIVSTLWEQSAVSHR